MECGSASVFEAPAGVAGLNDVAMVGEPVEYGGGHLGITEDLRPIGECEIGGLTMRALAPRVIDRFGFRAVLLIGTVASCARTAGFGLMHSPIYPIIVPLLIAAGFMQALVFTDVNGIIFC